MRIKDFIGLRLLGVRRAFYEFAGIPDRSEGLIELSFSNGKTVWFDVGPDGETLALYEGRWVDPFAPPLSSENEEYIHRHGKYSVYDVGGESEYRDLISKEILSVKNIVDEDTSRLLAL
jgi:hypothetical protein